MLERFKTLIEQIREARILRSRMIQWTMTLSFFLVLASLFYAKAFGTYFFADDVDTFGRLAEAVRDGQLIRYLFEPINKHVVIVSKLPYLLSYLTDRQIFPWHVYLFGLFALTCTTLFFFFKLLWKNTLLAGLLSLFFFFAVPAIDYLDDTYSSGNILCYTLIAVSMHLWLIYLRNRDRKALAASITTGVLCTFSISPGLFVWVLFALLSFREKEKKILPYLLPVSMAGLTFGIIWLIRSAYPASGDVLQSDIIKGLSYTWKGTNLVTFSFVSTWWQKSVLLAVALILLVTKRVQPRGLAIAAAIMIVPLWMTLTMRSSFTDSYVWLRYYFMPSLGLCMLAGELLQAPWREKLSMSRQSVSFVILAVLLPMIYLNARETDRVQNAGPLTSYLEINAEAVKFEQAYRDAAYRYAAYYRTSTISVPAIELPITGYPGTHTPRFILGYVLPYSDKLTVVEQAGSDFFTFFRAP